jgi:sulfatase modifying factor 1
MVYIQSGSFIMGSKAGEDDEKVQHEVYLDEYWIGKKEVTKAQFRLFSETKGYITDAERNGGAYYWTGNDWQYKEGLNWKNPEFKQEDNHPVVCISWNDANAYCNWLSNKLNRNFKLPSEAQWEKAAHSIMLLKFPWGNHKPDHKGQGYANYKAHDSWDKRGEDGYRFTAPVGIYSDGASPYGVLDMAGNAWEWCNDIYDSGYYKVSPSKNPVGPSHGDTHVLRGGSWGFDVFYLRCSERRGDLSSECSSNSGFRLCMFHEQSSS